MGYQNVKSIATADQRKEFLYHLMNDVSALGKMVKEGLFEEGIRRIGAEQEFCIVTKNFRPSTNSLKILEEIDDPHFVTEMGLFNLEINMDPMELKGGCFREMEAQLSSLLKKAHIAADKIEENKIVLTGILPTLRKKDLAVKNMTPVARYKAMNQAMKEIRGDEFELVIKGVDELNIKSKSILFEACNTSFQVHLQIPLDEIVDKYNWAQVISGPVLSVMTNSPLLFGRELRSETRIAVFQQSIDTRNTSYHLREQKPRVSFGKDWVKNEITDVYKDDISRYTAFLTSDFNEDSLETIKKGKIPELKALCLHNSTLYKWNRLCYGITEGKPHLRIESRYMPSGPTVVDEIANALFWVGLMQGMPEKYKNVWNLIPFNDAHGNFINASRTGINTYFNWFGEGITASKLFKRILLPLARKGLLQSGVYKKDVKYYLGIIRKRVDGNKTGSKWMIRNYRALKKEMANDEANVTLTSGMYKRQMEGKPVHLWKPIQPNEGKGIENMYNKVRHVMTTELFVVHEWDLISLVVKIMEWKNIHHIPVVNKNNKLIGILNQSIINEESRHKKQQDLLTVRDVMKNVIVQVNPEMTIENVKKTMDKYKIDCLPVVEDEELIGIFTKSDLKRVIEKQQNG